jgi:hypothetical protein
MKEFDINVREISETIVTVQAEDATEAELKVRKMWNDSEVILESSDFNDVEFSTLEEREMEQMEGMDCLLIKPGEYPEAVKLETGLEALQNAVSGNIEVVYPFEDQVGLIVNEEGKINGLPLNRPLYDSEGELYDILAGNILVVGLTEDNFASLTPTQMKHYEELFHQPQTFVRLGKGILAIPIMDDALNEKPFHDTMEKTSRAEIL